jgi:hypothetical protein
MSWLTSRCVDRSSTAEACGGECGRARADCRPRRAVSAADVRYDGDAGFSGRDVDAIETTASSRCRRFSAQRLDFRISTARFAAWIAADHVVCCARDADDQLALRRWRAIRPCGQPAGVRLLWQVAQVPDFRRRCRTPTRSFSPAIPPSGDRRAQRLRPERRHLDRGWRIEALPSACPRTWTFITHRAEWLNDPAHWQERARAIEDRLSDALHERLAERFVDRRTAVLVRDIVARGADALPVTVAADGEVSVGPEPIGHLAGFDDRTPARAARMHKREDQLLARIFTRYKEIRI